MLVGITGSGKSTLLKYIITNLFTRSKILIYDSEHEHEPYTKNIRVFRPSETYSIEQFERMNQWIYETGNIIYCIENIDFFAKREKPLPFWFAKIVGLGRKRNIGLIMTTRRIADVHKTVCSQVKVWFLFRQFLPNDVYYLKQFIGEIAYKLKDLKQYHFIAYRIGEKPKVYMPINV